MLDLFNSSLMLQNSLVVPASVFIAGLIGSPHCLSMCGPIVVNFAGERSRLAAYQFGRMIAYTTVGALVGVFGQALLGSSRPTWLSSLSLAFIGLLLLFNGYRAWTGQPLHLKMPAAVNRQTFYFWQWLKNLSIPPSLLAGLAGVFTVFLPCGHLYSFLIGAVATGSATKGAAFMFAFWLGSAPLLSVSGSWLQKILRPKVAGGQRWAGALLIAAGMFSIASFALKLQEPAAATAESHQEHHHHH